MFQFLCVGDDVVDTQMLLLDYTLDNPLGIAVSTNRSLDSVAKQANNANKCGLPYSPYVDGNGGVVWHKSSCLVVGTFMGQHQVAPSRESQCDQWKQMCCLVCVLDHLMCIAKILLFQRGLRLLKQYNALGMSTSISAVLIAVAHAFCVACPTLLVWRSMQYPQ